MAHVQFDLSNTFLATTVRWPRFRGHGNPLNWLQEASAQESHDGQTEWQGRQEERSQII